MEIINSENITLDKKVSDYEKIITENPIFLQRTKGKGVLSKDLALNESITGVNLRASGVDLDFRKKDNLFFYITKFI